MTHDPFPWASPPPVDDYPPAPTDREIREIPREDFDARSSRISSSIARQQATALERATIANALDHLSGDVGALGAFTRATRDRVAEVLLERAEKRRAARPDVVTDQADLRLELVGAADDAEVLERLGAVFVETSKLARGIAGDLVAELPERRGKPVRTVHVGDGQGSRLTVNTTQPTEAFAELDAIVEIVGTATIGVGTAEGATWERQAPYGAGVRDGIAAILEVLASPKVKTTALDELARQLEGRGEDALAKRLRAQYGRRDKGEPTVKIERTPLAEDTTGGQG